MATVQDITYAGKTYAGETLSTTLPPVAIRRMGAFNLVGLWSLTAREIRRFLKVYLQTLVGPLVTTQLYYAIFALALGGAYRVAGDIPYLTFLAPGLIMMTMVQNAFANSSSAMIIGKYEGSIVDLLLPPLSAFELTFAKVMGGVARGVFVGIAAALGLVFFHTLGCHSIFYIAYYAVMGSMLLSLLGLIAGILGSKFDHIAAMTNFVVTPLTFLSGTFYSVESLPENWQFVAHLNPFFYMIDGFRYGITGHAESNLGAGVLIFALVNAGLWMLAVWLFDRGIRIKS